MLECYLYQRILIFRAEYEEKRVQGRLRDPKTIPLIATKHYAKALALQENQHATSPAAFSPDSSMCRKCQQYLGTADQDYMCSACYRESDSSRQLSDKCRQCHNFIGMKENHYYCSRCYNEILEGGPVDERQTNNSNVTGLYIVL